MIEAKRQKDAEKLLRTLRRWKRILCKGEYWLGHTIIFDYRGDTPYLYGLDTANVFRTQIPASIEIDKNLKGTTFTWSGGLRYLTENLLIKIKKQDEQIQMIFIGLKPDEQMVWIHEFRHFDFTSYLERIEELKRMPKVGMAKGENLRQHIHSFLKDMKKNNKAYSKEHLEAFLKEHLIVIDGVNDEIALLQKQAEDHSLTVFDTNDETTLLSQLGKRTEEFSVYKIWKAKQEGSFVFITNADTLLKYLRIIQKDEFNIHIVKEKDNGAFIAEYKDNITSGYMFTRFKPSDYLKARSQLTEKTIVVFSD